MVIDLFSRTYVTERKKKQRKGNPSQQIIRTFITPNSELSRSTGIKIHTKGGGGVLKFTAFYKQL